jgi:hypothetical protein
MARIRALHFLLIVCAEATANLDFAELFYNITHQEYMRNIPPSGDPPQLQLLRVPKASSSSLSQIARRAAGCDPPGPCCKFPGDPPGTCPSPELFQCKLQSRLIGCTNHYVDYEALWNASIVSISMVREPVSRALSAFSYPGRHHNSNCTADGDVCFRQYLQDRRWSNVVTKMFTGAYAYADVPTCKRAMECPHSLELALQNLKLLAFVGVSEAWELSLLLLHRRLRHLTPELLDFYLNDRKSGAPSGPGKGRVLQFPVSSPRFSSLTVNHLAAFHRRRRHTLRAEQYGVPRVSADTLSARAARAE